MTIFLRLPNYFSIIFELAVRQAEKKINLGGIMLSTGSPDTRISFQCVYSVRVTVTSDPLSVRSAAAGGNLADGFSLILGDGNNAAIELGQMLDVTVTWNLSLSDVSFYLRNCYLQQGASTVKVVKDGCLSETLQVSHTSQMQKSQSFRMMIFSIDGEESNEQFIDCFIKLCMQNCDKPTSDDQCPDDENYSYSLRGWKIPKHV